jgi:NAD(P) transhydrogenase subunit alpha
VILSVPRESHEGERRVALVPETVARLARAGIEVRIQSGAGAAAHISDDEYRAKGAAVLDDPIPDADVVVKVREWTAGELDRMKAGACFIGLWWPLQIPDRARALAERRITGLSLDLIPRISRAQTMDVLSSMSTVAGYKAVLRAADLLPRFFPMLMTAAGTIAPAKVLVIGAGVAGLQAIATARRLGAVVEAYDVRPVAKEQVESLGARWVDLGLEAADAQDAGGYAKAQTEEFYREQQKRLADRVAQADVVITTALIPGKPAPKLVIEDGVRRMKPGSVIVDLAAEQGGNCELTEPGREIVRHGVTIAGMIDVPSTLAPHASQMFSRNVGKLLETIVRDGALRLDREDEIVRGCLVTHGGEVVHERVRALLAERRA